ncbi:histidinol-phosphate phosphatase [Nitratireductor indicus C115]|uniref:Histidinol-phosphatase n=1 Tax=Nitratireductor indicus C115 TaxID=1231190 RepID=K2NSU5_9HYPH|nr:histidinol-phosphatase [Nitratireductor indicus]EKF42425.1 histidinol-phosphate phosphatase [Nitratireductor indicus C115]SFQ55853.1 histidinol-phosphatase, inositol monophosphatase family [Nitratireductor indicus]
MTISPAFLRRVAAAAAAETLPRFRHPVSIDNKLAGGFDPVTEADREAERAIRALIVEDYPDDGIHGEEFGLEREASERRWIIDPIDGTRAFISGIPLWGTLVGLTAGGRAQAGMMSQPFTGELFFATGEGTYYEGPGGNRRLAARDTTELSDATLCTTTPSLFDPLRRPAYDRVEAAVCLPRYGTDCYAYAMLAAGQVDLVIESGLQPYDIVALIPIVEQAGGVITTWAGGRAEGGGDVIAAATPRLHEKAMALLR